LEVQVREHIQKIKKEKPEMDDFEEKKLIKKIKVFFLCAPLVL
jgi:hypothetical protein